MKTSNNNVFINCPFDDKYKEFLAPLLFTVIYCNLIPQISETNDSGSVRLNNILKLIKASKFSIHDISRLVASKAGEISRFNLPFELGMDFGLRYSENNSFSEKKCLIIDKQNVKNKYTYQAAISDISGSDIECYDNIQELVRIVSNWISKLGFEFKSGPRIILENYYKFELDYKETLDKNGFSLTDILYLPKSYYIESAQKWIDATKK